MLERISTIANNLGNRLTALRSTFNAHLVKTTEDNLKNSPLVHCLLYFTCRNNMLKELNEILQLKLFTNINNPLKATIDVTDINITSLETTQKFVEIQMSGRTLLGLAAFYGHLEIVKYLVEMQLANVNTIHAYGNSSLHETVLGDSNRRYLNQQDKITKYLLQNGADLTLQNDEKMTPYDLTQRKPTIMPLIFIPYDGKKVFPILESPPVVRKSLKIESKSFDMFCLENAIHNFIHEDKWGFGLKSLDQFFQKLNTLEEKDIKDLFVFINAQHSQPCSFSESIKERLHGLNNKDALVAIIILTFGSIISRNSLVLLRDSALAYSFYFTLGVLKEKFQSFLQVSLKNEKINQLQQHPLFFNLRSSSHRMRDEKDGCPLVINHAR